MSKGKTASQAVHAALAYYSLPDDGVVVLTAPESKIKQMKICIRDAGKTEIKPGTITAGIN